MMQIDALAHELLELQRTSRRLLESDDIETWLNAVPAEFRAAERLRSHLLNHPAVVTDDPAVKQLLAGIDLVAELDDPDKAGMERLWGSISSAEYATNLAMVGVLVAPFDLPANLQQFLEEARECYAMGHYAAVQSLSRTILEAAFNDVAVRTGKLPSEVIERDMFRKYPPRDRINLVAGAHAEQVYSLYRTLCKVVHGLSTTSTEGALGALTKTIGFVQHIYELNKNLIPDDLRPLKT
jgi:hypothetical protein